MTLFQVEVDVASVVRGIGRLSDGVEARVASAVSLTGAELLASVSRKAATGFHAPGEPHLPGTGPGPNVALGDYVRSINLTTGYEGGVATAVVATNAPQARRLEYGFLPPNIDSLGRGFHQPPYPHWRPAKAEIEPRLIAAVGKALSGALGDL